MKSKILLFSLTIASIILFNYNSVMANNGHDLKLNMELDFFAITPDRSINLHYATYNKVLGYKEDENAVEFIERVWTEKVHKLRSANPRLNIQSAVLKNPDELNLQIIIIPASYRNFKYKSVIASFPWLATRRISFFERELSLEHDQSGFLVENIPAANKSYILLEYCPLTQKLNHDGIFYINLPTEKALVFQGIANKTYVLIYIHDKIESGDPIIGESFQFSAKMIPSKIVYPDAMNIWNWEDLLDISLQENEIKNILAKNSTITYNEKL